MKKLALLCLLVLTPMAYADQEDEKILGAIAGGYLGSTIGGGDGKKAATVLGAIIGYRVGPQVLGSNQGYTYGYQDRRWRQPRYRQADIYKICDHRNPYTRDSRLYWSYNRGCVQRLSDEMRELEQQAYEQGYQGQ
jgi:uncharacterized protein YcfJ